MPSSVRSRRRLFACALLVLGATVWCGRASAYRPFDGTDAAVADLGQLEIELGLFGLLWQQANKTLIAPAAIVNYGFAKNWELVLQGQLETPLSSSDPSSFTMAGAFLKGVLRPGSLQEKTGLRIPTKADSCSD